MSINVARYLGFKVGAVVKLHDAGTFGVVDYFAENDDDLKSPSGLKRIWCTFQQSNGKWASGRTWMSPEQGRVIGPEEGADEIFASYAAWRLTQ